MDKLCGGKRNQQEQIFRQTRWNPLVNSSTLAEFENKWESIVATYSTRNKSVVRYLAGTWIPHKEKFVRAWTNDCLHIGNQIPAELKANTRLSKIILVTVIAHLIPCLKEHTYR